jgi:hypothetical protein
MVSPTSASIEGASGFHANAATPAARAQAPASRTPQTRQTISAATLDCLAGGLLVVNDVMFGRQLNNPQ